MATEGLIKKYYFFKNKVVRECSKFLRINYCKDYATGCITAIELYLRRTLVRSYPEAAIISHLAARCIHNYIFKDILQHI